MKATENEEKKARLGIRIDPKVFDRLDDAVHEMRKEARTRGERLTQDMVVQNSITHYLDFVDGKGGEISLAIKEILASGDGKAQRTLKASVDECLGHARAYVEKRPPKTAG